MNSNSFIECTEEQKQALRKYLTKNELDLKETYLENKIFL